MAQHPVQAQTDIRTIVREELAANNKALLEAIVCALKEAGSPAVDSMTTAMIEALKVHTPIVANLTATLSAEKTVAMQAGSIQQLQAQNDVLSSRLTEMTTSRAKQPKKAATETAPSQEATPGADAPKQQAPIKAPTTPRAIGTFSNRLLFFKFLAENGNPLYSTIATVALVAAAKETLEYKQCLASKGSVVPSGIKACAAMEATQIYKVISKNNAYEAQMKALTDAMNAHNAGLTAPTKIETIEKID